MRVGKERESDAVSYTHLGCGLKRVLGLADSGFGGAFAGFLDGGRTVRPPPEQTAGVEVFEILNGGPGDGHDHRQVKHAAQIPYSGVPPHRVHHLQRRWFLRAAARLTSVAVEHRLFGEIQQPSVAAEVTTDEDLSLIHI